MNSKSLFIATASALVGLALWIDDDLLLMLGVIGPDVTFARRICGSLEFFFMVPGAAMLGWILAERFRRSKERLEQIEARARRDRLVALGRVAAGLAHEVRNPLHNLRLILEGLHHGDTAEEREHLLKRADTNITRIDHAVELVYRLARPRTTVAQVETSNLSAMLMEAIAAENERTPQVPVRCATIPSAHARCAGDDVRLALDNLLRNATAADHTGVDVSLRAVGDAWEVLLVNRGTLPSWVEVGDDARATSNKPDGLGLGLSISRQLISEAGGTLQLLQVGPQVEARLTLPRANEASA